MNFSYFKCNGNGNTFIIVIHHNSIANNFFNPSGIKNLCYLDDKEAVDGLITINIKENLFLMDYYNNDGSWETLCLNGLRCASLLIFNKLKKKNINIICNEIEFKTLVLDNNFVQVQLPEPHYKSNNIKVVNLMGDFIDSGAKHFVINYTKKWPAPDKLLEISKEIRYNTLLFPDGTNVNYYKILNKNKIEVKTYEKGVESIMSSCGSGSFACAYDFSKKNNYLGIIKVINDGGVFQFSFSENYNENFLIGKAEIEYEKEIEIN